MARGKQSPAPVSLPVVSFTRIDDKEYNRPGGVDSKTERTFGYNDFSDFKRPSGYIRYIEPLESELAVQVEYDMDEQDQEWLDEVNTERHNDQLDKVSYEMFEVIMDRLEKEWFDLTKNIPRPEMDLPSEDSTCAICDDSEGENMNAIVFCDGCNLAVHQDCYGVPYIPEGQWLCRKCTVSPEIPVSCILCPNEGGAFKQTVTGDWAHLLCAIWVPETRVANEVFMEPITGVEKIPKQRWKLKCSLCDVREGACIQCSKSSCFVAFHPTCARKEKFLMPMKGAAGVEPGMLTCYCERHLPKEQADAREAALAQHQSGPDNPDSTLSRTARAYAKTYKQGAPLVPAIIVSRILQYIAKVSIRKKTEFVHMVCRYWSLKREARRGAPLLKRLHLEPWTANKGGNGQTDEEKAIKLQHMRRLRADLEYVRLIIGMIPKRENIKLEQAQAIQELLQSFLFAHETPLRAAFEKIIAKDTHDHFKNPVSRVDVPDYFEVIEKPMCWTWIENKLDRHGYWDVQSFKEDILLVLDNAKKYNAPDSLFYRTASRIHTHAISILSNLDRPNSEAAAIDDRTVGDLEPEMDVVEMLLAEQPDKGIKEELEFILESNPIAALTSYELPQDKPPPPPPPPKPRAPRKTKTASVRKPIAQDVEQLDAAPGFRTRRTRQSAAAEANKAAENAEAASAAGAAPVVTELDNRSMFANFDSGWILEDGQGRGGRRHASSGTPITQATSASRGGARATSGKGRRKRNTSLALATSVSANQTLQEDTAEASSSKLSSVSPTAPTADGDVDEVMAEPVDDVDDLGDSASQGRGSGTKRRKVEQQKPIVIDVIETPATRREKARQKKEERERLKASQNPGGAPVQRRRRGPERGRPKKAIADLDGSTVMSEPSELSELTDLSEDSQTGQQSNEGEGEGGEGIEHGVSEGGKTNQQDGAVDGQDDGGEQTAPGEDDHPPSSKASSGDSAQREEPEKAEAPAEVQPFDVVIDYDNPLEPGTLVWAKAHAYPWWAAVVFEAPDPAIPADVDRDFSWAYAEAKKAGKPPLTLIQFYDKKRTWTFLPPDKLKLLGEDDKLDMMMIDGKNGIQHFKNKKFRAECRDSYRQAKAEMETAQDRAAAERESEEQDDQSTSPTNPDTPMEDAPAPVAEDHDERGQDEVAEVEHAADGDADVDKDLLDAAS